MPDDGGEHALVAALARRVDDQSVDAAGQGGENVLDIAEEKFGVLDAVVGGVALGVADGLRHALNADHAPGMLRKQQRNGADAAVGVHNGFVGLCIDEAHRLAVQHGRLLRIDLQKRLRTDGEREIENRFRERRFAGEQPEIRPKDHVRVPLVDIVPYAVHIGEQRQQLIGVGETVRRGHDHGHGLAGGGDARHHMAQHAAAGAFIISRDMAGIRPFLHAAHDVHDALVLNGTVGDGHEPVAARREKAKGNAMPARGEREAALVAVTPRNGHAARFAHGGIFDAAKPPKRIHDGLPFDRELLAIVEVLQRTAAARGVCAADRLHARTGGFQHLGQLADGVAARHLDDVDADALARQRAGHKHGVAVDPADALSFTGQRVDGELKIFVLLHGKLLFHRSLMFSFPKIRSASARAAAEASR